MANFLWSTRYYKRLTPVCISLNAKPVGGYAVTGKGIATVTIGTVFESVFLSKVRVQLLRMTMQIRWNGKVVKKYFRRVCN